MNDAKTIGETGFTFSDKDTYDLIPAGDYEVVLESCEKRQYGVNKDKNALSCRFRIREDVEQEAKKRVVFDNIWEDKVNPLWYDLNKLGKIIRTQPNGKRDFTNVDECIQYINGLNMIVTIDKKFDDYRNQEINEIRYLSYKPSIAGSSDDEIDDLPF